MDIDIIKKTMDKNNFYITILAGGLGKRMNSSLPKILHEVNGIPMIVKIINEVIKLNPFKILIIVGKYKDIIDETITKYININNIEYVIQETALGTGHAILCSLNHLDNDGINLIVNGDTPMLTYETLNDIKQFFVSNNYKLLITSINLKDPFGCGRIILNNNIFEKIVEEKDSNLEQKKITLINCGMYIATNKILKKYIPLIKNENIQQEFYLTDIVEIYKIITNKNIGLYIMDSTKELEIININTKKQLDELNKILIE